VIRVIQIALTGWKLGGRSGAEPPKSPILMFTALSAVMWRAKTPPKNQRGQNAVGRGPGASWQRPDGERRSATSALGWRSM